MMQELVAALRKMARAELDNIHTAVSATITSYDPVTGTASVQPIGNITIGKTKQAYPILHDLPVVFPQGAGQSASIVYPVSVGDTCLVIFSEKSIAKLMLGQDTGADLRFDLSSGICIPGLFATAPAAAEEANRDHAVIISAGETRLKVGPSGVRITGNLTVTGTVESAG